MGEGEKPGVGDIEKILDNLDPDEIGQEESKDE